jgi:hypothetical protein
MKKNFTIVTLLAFLLVNPPFCKKYVEQQEENALLAIVTKGQWSVTRYLEFQSKDLSDSLAGYAFQFNADGTLYGVKFGQQTNGTYSVDIGNKNITTNFPAATYPITLLNHTWTITDSYTDSVAAKTAVDSSFNILNIRKI